MLTILVSRNDITVIETTGFAAQVRNTIVKEGDKYVSLQDSQPFQEYDDIEMVLMGRFFDRKLRLTTELKMAIKRFMREYHAQQNIEVDCYAFANTLKGIKPHKVHNMLRYWNIKRLWWRPKPGSVIFLVKGKKHFRHAAIYIGRGLYISTWGAGGDLEIASLKSMKRDFGANRVELATPR